MEKIVKVNRTLKQGLSIVFFILFSFQTQAQLADDKCKFLGNVIAGFVPSDFSTRWNQVTPENAGKWGSVEPTRDAMSWNGLDLVYNTAVSNGLAFKQHTFVWGQQQPAWIADLPQAEQKEEVEEWIRSFCEKYPQTDFIDVVNEPLHAPPGYYAALGGNGTTGWDWVIWAFEKARQYCPNAKLILNDYNIISNDGATNSYVAIINLLKSRNLIDIIGEQGHFLETTPLNTIRQNLDKLAATGLPIHISEFDINLANDNAQRDKYAELFPVLWEHNAVQGITLWGYRQGQIWRPDAYLVRSDETARPALTWLNTYMETAPGGIFCLPPAGIEEELIGVKVYPNPALHGKFKVEAADRNVQVLVMDVHGRMIKNAGVIEPGISEIQLDEPPGLYIIQISRGQQKTFKKLQVN